MNVKLLRSLQVFVKVADTGNMSVAAKSLHMTVSAISQQLRKLEQDIGLSLFNRNTRNLSLTEAGGIYYRTSIELLNTAERAHREIEQLQLVPTGELKIIAPEGFGGGLLSQPLQTLTRDFPKISISLTVTDEPTDIIASGTDLLICFAPMSDSNYTTWHLATWDRLLCVAKDHPLANAELNSPEDLDPHCHIVHRHIEDYVVRGPDKRELPLPKTRLDVNSMQTMIQLTKDGIGYAVLPEPEIRHCLEDGSLVQILPEWELPNYNVYAVTPKHESVPAKIQTAIGCLQDWFSTI